MVSTSSELAHVTATINGQQVDVLVPPSLSLLDTLREVAGLTGTKEGCLDGNCGACTVIMDGRTVDSCLVLGVEASGKQITTIEGIASAQGLHPLQQSFLEEAALQCGICTPGFIVAAKALLDREPHADEHRIRHWLAGNLCRCTGYDKIVRAVIKAEDMAAQLQKGSSRNGTRPAAKATAAKATGAKKATPGKTTAARPGATRSASGKAAPAKKSPASRRR